MSSSHAFVFARDPRHLIVADGEHVRILATGSGEVRGNLMVPALRATVGFDDEVWCVAGTPPRLTRIGFDGVPRGEAIELSAATGAPGTLVRAASGTTAIWRGDAVDVVTLVGPELRRQVVDGAGPGDAVVALAPGRQLVSRRDQVALVEQGRERWRTAPVADAHYAHGEIIHDGRAAVLVGTIGDRSGLVVVGVRDGRDQHRIVIDRARSIAVAARRGVALAHGRIQDERVARRLRRRGLRPLGGDLAGHLRHHAGADRVTIGQLADVSDPQLVPIDGRAPRLGTLGHRQRRQLERDVARRQRHRVVPRQAHAQRPGMAPQDVAQILGQRHVVAGHRLEAVDARQHAEQLDLLEELAQALGRRALAADERRRVDDAQGQAGLVGDARQHAVTARALATAHGDAERRGRARERLAEGVATPGVDLEVAEPDLGRPHRHQRRQLGQRRATAQRGGDDVVDGEGGERPTARRPVDPHDAEPTQRRLGVERRRDGVAAVQRREQLDQQVLVAQLAAFVVGERAVELGDLAPQGRRGDEQHHVLRHGIEAEGPRQLGDGAHVARLRVEPGPRDVGGGRHDGEIVGGEPGHGAERAEHVLAVRQPPGAGRCLAIG